jgi:hypothetical protein
MARYKKILQGINQARFEPASRFSEDAIDLIKSVCDKDPSQRLPMKPGGVKKNLYTHPLFEEDKWDKLDAGMLKKGYKLQYHVNYFSIPNSETDFKILNSKSDSRMHFSISQTPFLFHF